MMPTPAPTKRPPPLPAAAKRKLPPPLPRKPGTRRIRVIRPLKSYLLKRGVAIMRWSEGPKRVMGQGL
jgi:hypothetical protein